ncbi:MAG: hypothetical protein ACKO8Q_01100, partial [Bacteroidota bacterium]
FLATEIGKKREALNFLNDIIVLLQKEGNSRQLFTTIANKAVLHAQLNEKTETFKALDELAKFPQFQLYASTFLTVCIELEENDRAWNEIQNWLEQDLLSARAQHIRTAHLFFQAAIVAFKKKEFKWAEKFTFKIIQEFPQNEGLHLLSITHLFYLVIQIELKNERFMPYALRNVQRFLQTRHRQFEPEKKLLQFVNELLKKRKSIGALSPWQWLSQELQKLKSSDPRFFSYFNFLEWAESKILRGI